MSDTEPRPSASLLTLTAVAIAICALLLAYTSGYFFLGTKHVTVDTSTGRTVVVKSFRSEWQAIAYVPAAMLEDLLTGNGAVAAPE